MGHATEPLPFSRRRHALRGKRDDMKLLFPRAFVRAVDESTFHVIPARFPGAGSVVTYLQRYSLMCIFVAAEDPPSTPFCAKPKPTILSESCHYY
jgi:hypothetical protein